MSNLVSIRHTDKHGANNSYLPLLAGIFCHCLFHCVANGGNLIINDILVSNIMIVYNCLPHRVRMDKACNNTLSWLHFHKCSQYLLLNVVYNLPKWPIPSNSCNYLLLHRITAPPSPSPANIATVLITINQPHGLMDRFTTDNTTVRIVSTAF